MNTEDIAVQKDFIRGRPSRNLYFDVEVTPNLTWTYDMFKGAYKLILPQKVMSYAYQWEGEEEIKVKALPDYAGYQPGIFHVDDGAICHDMYDLLSQADVIIGHNVKGFDLKIVRSRFLAHGMMPLKRVEIVDTLLILWQQFALPKNDLDSACRYVGLPGKDEKRHADYFQGCIDGVMKDWEGEKTYNMLDVKITHALYNKIRGWHPGHPNLNLIQRQGNNCPTCGSEKHIKYGIRPMKTGIKQRYACMNCGQQWVGEYIARAIDGQTENIIQSRG